MKTIHKTIVIILFIVVSLFIINHFNNWISLLFITLLIAGYISIKAIFFHKDQLIMAGEQINSVVTAYKLQKKMEKEKQNVINK